MKKFYLLLLLCFAFVLPAGSAMAEEGEMMTAEEFEASLAYKRGLIELPEGGATLQVPEQFRFLDSADARRLLENAWGNPPDPDVLGMLIPSDASPLSAEGWGIVITYIHDGHVDDSDAAEIDYNELLVNMQDETAAASAEREQIGYEPVELVGWAEPPYYDASSHKFHWAKEIRFGDSEINTLNYNIRILGREGVLLLNAVAGMDQLGTIKAQVPEVLAFTNFTEGNTYADFDASTDTLATYGLAALVGGAAAKKLGLLAVITAFLVKGWKLILVGFAAFAAFFAKRKKKAA